VCFVFCRYLTIIMHYDPNQALARIDNDVPLLRMLIGVFLKERLSYSNKLLEALKHQQWLQLGEAAHTVKGAAAAIGLETVHEAAAHVEMLCKHSAQHDPQGCLQKAHALLTALDQCPQALQPWLSECDSRI
jgi:HPt (histidine-containing phosphotransfer) domain-containing protein